LASEQVDLVDASNPFKWKNISTTYQVNDPSITSLDFRVEAVDAASTGWDFGQIKGFIDNI